MHLINCITHELVDFIGSDIPAYAILSHTWSQGEVSYAEMRNNRALARLKEGYAKINFTCQQALIDNVQYAWVDTCCIDKTSSAELSESINSMFKWYKSAAVCYVYLSDVDITCADYKQQFSLSRWFTRGWTLQELLAPKDVTFYDRKWKRLGTKIENAQWICDITKIDKQALVSDQVYINASPDLKSFCCAQKMSWASHRQTTRGEDIAYSLLGIFDITMPLLYGEGWRRAFQRLQEAILRQSGDDTILAWGLNTDVDYKYQNSVQCSQSPTYSFLADSPRSFESCGKLRRAPLHPVKMSLSSLGLQIQVPLLQFRTIRSNELRGWLAVLSCRLHGSDSFVGIYLMDIESATLFDGLVQATEPMRNSDWKSIGHATTVDAHGVAEASLQEITIVVHDSHWRDNPRKPLEIERSTHVIIFPTEDFVANGLFFSDARGIRIDQGNTEYPTYSQWDPAKSELVLKDFAFDVVFSHRVYLLLWVKRHDYLYSPLYRIQICGSCGEYVVSKWDASLRDANQMYGHNYDTEDSPRTHALNSIFKLERTMKEMCQRNIIMLNIDIGDALF